MKQYASIPHFDGISLLDREIIAFDKLDGNNLRFEWSKNKGWFKFGTRHVIIDASHKEYGVAISTFLEKYAQSLINVFKSNEKYHRIKGVIVFCEWFGQHSFAGQYDPNDKMELILFDVNPIGKGMVPPREFIENFGHLEIPKVIYEGALTMEFVEKVKKNEFNLREGVVCKVVDKEKGNRVLMVKIKTDEWLEKLKEKYGMQALKDELAGKSIGI